MKLGRVAVAAVTALLVNVLPNAIPAAGAAAISTPAPLATVTMTCSTGQYDINQGDQSTVAAALRLDPAVAGRLVAGRPWLRPNDLLTVAGIGKGWLEPAIAAGLLCAAPASTPPPALDVCTPGLVDVQTAPADQLRSVFGMNANTAERFIAARPFAALRQIVPDRVPGFGSSLQALVAKKGCLTPPNITTSNASWSWAYAAQAATDRRGLFALNVPAGTIDVSPGAWLSITEIAQPGHIDGPRADFHIWGPWQAGGSTVQVTAPRRIPGYVPTQPMVDAIAHYTGGDVQFFTGSATALTPADSNGPGTLTVTTDSLSGWTTFVTPFRIISAPTATNNLALRQAVLRFIGIRAAAVSCSPDATNDQLIHSTGIEPNNDYAPVKYCVEIHDGQAWWKIANNTGTVININVQNAGHVIAAGNSGDLLTDLEFAGFNGISSDPSAGEQAAQAWVAPGATAYVAEPQGTLNDPIVITASPELSVGAFVSRQLASVVPAGELRQLYDILNRCGYSLSVKAGEVNGYLQCAMSALAVIGTAAAKEIIEDLGMAMTILDGIVSATDTLLLSLSPGQLNATFGFPPPTPPSLPGGGGGGGAGGGVGGGPDGTIVGRGPTSGVIWRLAGGANLDQRGQPYVIPGTNGVAFTTLNPTRATCLSQHYVVRDFVMPGIPLLWFQESAFEAVCPTSSPVLDLPVGATNWILRESSGAAWFVDGQSHLTNITTGGGYIACAQHYLVLDEVAATTVTRFGAKATAPVSTCGT